MGLESATYIDDLVITNPTSGDDPSAGDDHLRLIKSTIKNTFPNISAPVTPTHTELNYVDGVTSAIQTQLNAKLAATTFTAANLLTKLLTVDGGSSGLDAQYLNGQDSGYYLYWGDFTANNILTKIKTVDGSGSGLDADTLDGQHASYFAITPITSSKITWALDGEGRSDAIASGNAWTVPEGLYLITATLTDPSYEAASWYLQWYGNIDTIWRPIGPTAIQGSLLVMSDGSNVRCSNAESVGFSCYFRYRKFS